MDNPPVTCATTVTASTTVPAGSSGAAAPAISGGRPATKFSSNASSATVTVNGKTVVACLSHLSGTCVRHDCRYVHLKPEIRMLPACVCAYYAQGECKKGPHCRYFHGSTDELKRMKDCGFALYNPFTNEPYESIPADLEDESRMMLRNSVNYHNRCLPPPGTVMIVPQGGPFYSSTPQAVCGLYESMYPTLAYLPHATTAAYAFPQQMQGHPVLYQVVGDPNRMGGTPLPAVPDAAAQANLQATYVIITPDQSSALPLAAPPPTTQYVVIQP